MAPIVDGLEQEFAGKINVVRVDAAAPEGQTLAARFGLRGHPALYVVNAQGRIAQQFYGTPSADMVRAALQTVVP